MTEEARARAASSILGRRLAGAHRRAVDRFANTLQSGWEADRDPVAQVGVGTCEATEVVGRPGAHRGVEHDDVLVLHLYTHHKKRASVAKMQRTHEQRQLERATYRKHPTVPTEEEANAAANNASAASSSPPQQQQSA